LKDKLELVKRQNETLHKLNEIASISNLTPIETLREALIIGKEYFGLEFGIISNIKGNDYTVEVQSTPTDTLYDGQIFDLGSTYCKTTLEVDGVLAITDVTKSKYVGHPCHKEFELVSYIGAPIRVNEEVYGTINFSSPEPRQLEYDEIDDSFMSLLARWAGSFLERQSALDEITKLSKAIEQIDDTVIIADKDGMITFVNDAFTVHTGFSSEETIGKKTSILKSDEHDKAFYEKMWKDILDGKIFRGLVTNKRKNGELFYEDKTITPIKNEEGSVVSFVSTGRDITKRIEMQHDLEKLASTDSLTGIYNRHKFEEIFENEMERALRYKKPLSLIMFDIDYFKRVNDNFGHDFGDMVLKDIVNIVKDNIRNIDIFARWGGEEFFVLCPETSVENAEVFAQKLRKKIAEFSFKKIGKITSSFGVTSFADKDNKNTFIKRVDDALYRAKNEGRDTVEVIRPINP
jgi:diguanylate cyclase (GGDEF)-like protein/PAS domain S-box-containing protein